jgi:hypothetical protein
MGRNHNVLNLCSLTMGFLTIVMPTHDLFSQRSEVFKLQIGLEYEYAYQSWWEDSHIGTYQSSSDSGIIICRMIDSSSTSNSARTWLVHQTRRLIHHRNFGGFDTSYLVCDTTILPLSETTTGYHELRCTSPAWLFPEVHYDNQVTRVYRYADSSQQLLALAFPWCPRIALLPHDSLWLSADSGFSRRSSYDCIDDDYLGTYFMRWVTLRSLTLVSVEEELVLPTALELLAPYPNPFNSTTTLEFVSPDHRRVRLRILNMLGQEIACIFDGQAEPGRTIVSWNTSSSATGMYFVVLDSETNRRARKLILLK